MLIRNLLYILQSENYISKRFLKYAYSRFHWWNLEKRQKLEWTAKIRLIYAITLIFLAFLLVASFLLFNLWGLIITAILSIIFLPIIISLSAWIIKPIDFYLKNRIIKKAKEFLADKKITVIGITGSYGKTSTKEILSVILSEKFKVAKTSKNINTDIGIAGFILNNIMDEDIFIAEMGAHYPGDIAGICEMVNPDYSILTGINESHLERFMDLRNIIQEKFNLPQKTKIFSVLNFDDENIRKNYKDFKISNFCGNSKNNANDVKFLNNFEGLEFEYKEKIFKCGLLAEHGATLIIMCVEIALKLGMNLDEIKKGVEKIKPIEHRLSPIYNPASDIWVIDDSYNGNKNGFISGIEVLSRAEGRKVVLTPGLVELGEKAKIIHNELGELYAKNADLVLLIKNNVSDFIVSGMKKNNFKNYKVYKTTKEAHDDLKNILKSGDAILFQNDWTDNYY